jgi:hypothetical protein
MYLRRVCSTVERSTARTARAVGVPRGGGLWGVPEGPPLGGAIGVILGVFLQEHTKENVTDGPVQVCPVRVVGRVPRR